MLRDRNKVMEMKGLWPTYFPQLIKQIYFHHNEFSSQLLCNCLYMTHVTVGQMVEPTSQRLSGRRVDVHPSTSQTMLVLMGGLVVSVETQRSRSTDQHCRNPHQLTPSIYSYTHTQHTVCIGPGEFTVNTHTHTNRHANKSIWRMNSAE